MKRILLDTDVILDITLHREPFYADSLSVLKMLKEESIGCLTATTITNLYYIIRKQKGHAVALSIVKKIVQNERIQLLAVDQQVILQALHSGMADFEDSVQTAAAVISYVDIIVTRNIRDFQDVPITVLFINFVLRNDWRSAASPGISESRVFGQNHQWQNFRSSIKS